MGSTQQLLSVGYHARCCNSVPFDDIIRQTVERTLAGGAS